MDYSRFLFGDGDDHHHRQQQQLQPPQPSPKKELQLQGPRPTPLRVSKDSHSIRKPPRHPPPSNPLAPPPPDDPPHPLIIYSLSPKVIHVEESGFMSLVQRLTGLSPSGPRAGDVSPAARFASIERASPKHRPIIAIEGGMVGGDRGTTTSSTTTDDWLDPAAAGRGTMPGILSPAPSSLPAIPSGFFSPVKDSFGVPLFQDLVMSPLLQGSGGGGGGTWAGFFGGGGSGSSPSSAWFSSSLISPSPTSLDLYNLLADF